MTIPLKKQTSPILIIGGGLTALLLICGTFAVIGALVSPARSPESPAVGDAANIKTQAGNSQPLAPTTAAPVVETKTVIQTEPIAFTESNVNDSSLAAGTTRVKVTGAAGEKTVTYQVTYTNGVETARTIVSSVVTKPAVNQVIAVGTKVSAPNPPAPPASNCDPNYDHCVPIASDVDCAGGSGDGPAYVQGPIRVIGVDIYKLDSDHDGIACE